MYIKNGAEEKKRQARGFDIIWSYKRKNKYLHTEIEYLFWKLVHEVNLEVLSRRSGTIMDIGCGEGNLLSLCKNLSSEHVEYIGIDLSQRSAAMIIADAETLPIREGSIDFVICAEVIEHLPNPAACLNEISRILKTRGEAFITTPNKLDLTLRGPHYILRKFLRKLGIYVALMRIGITRGWWSESSYKLRLLDMNHEYAFHISEMKPTEIITLLRKCNLSLIKWYNRPFDPPVLILPFTRIYLLNQLVLRAYEIINSFHLLWPFKHIAILAQKTRETFLPNR